MCGISAAWPGRLWLVLLEEGTNRGPDSDWFSLLRVQRHVRGL